jgi:hypothetical protein
MRRKSMLMNFDGDTVDSYLDMFPPTRAALIEKCLPQTLSGKALHDDYAMQRAEPKNL